MIALMLLILSARAETERQKIRLAQDDAHAVERRGWKDGQPVALPHAPDVAATDRRSSFRTTESSPTVVNAHRGGRGGCVEFGDVRAFAIAYHNESFHDVYLMVTVNGKLAKDEDDNALFPATATSFTVRGLRPYDALEVLVVTESYQTVRRCSGVPSMETESVCDRGYILWERYVY